MTHLGIVVQVLQFGAQWDDELIFASFPVMNVVNINVKAKGLKRLITLSLHVTPNEERSVSRRILNAKVHSCTPI